MPRREMAEPREGIKQELTQRMLLEDEVRRELALERTSANRMRGMDVVPPPLGIAGPIDPLLQRYPSIPDAGIGQFSRQNDPPVPLYPPVPDAGIGQLGRQLDPPVPLYPSLISARPDPPMLRYTSVPDAAIDQLGRRIDYGQSLESVRGPEFGRGQEFGRSLESVRGPEFGQSLLFGPGPEFGRSLGLGQGEIWRAAAPSLLPPYDLANMIGTPPVMHPPPPPPPRKANASSLPVVGGKGRTVTRVEIALDSVATEWSCALCKVSTSSQLDLDLHLQGKEHLAIVEKVNAAKATRNDDTTSPSKKTTEAAEESPGKKPKVESSSESDEENRPHSFECEMCRVVSPNLSQWNAHLRGKRHRTLLDLSKLVGPEKLNRFVDTVTKRPRRSRARGATGADAKNHKPRSRRGDS